MKSLGDISNYNALGFVIYSFHPTQTKLVGIVFTSDGAHKRSHQMYNPVL